MDLVESVPLGRHQISCRLMQRPLISCRAKEHTSPGRNEELLVQAASQTRR